MDDKVHGREGNNPEQQLRSQIMSKWCEVDIHKQLVRSFVLLHSKSACMLIGRYIHAEDLRARHKPVCNMQTYWQRAFRKSEEGSETSWRYQSVGMNE